MKMRKILENDNSKLMKLWGFLARRYIIFHKSCDLKFFEHITDSNVQLLCTMGEIKIYNENDNKNIDLKNGGIVLSGSIKINEEGKD